MKTTVPEHPIDAAEDAAPIPPVLKENSDQAFFIRFGIVVLLLFAAAGGFALIAQLVGAPTEEWSMRHALIDERTHPIGQVATSPEALAALSPPDAAANAAPLTAQQTVDQYCAACHVAGLLGAPKAGDAAAWAKHEAAAGGADGLLASAIKGKGQMPPRGGAVGISDDTLREAIALLRR